jgi:predicted enzyme related to lactoylglutathione lyase
VILRYRRRVAVLTVDCITINAQDPAALAGFWAALIGGTPSDAGTHFVLLDPGGGRVPLLFQQSDAPASRQGWVHLDLGAPRREEAIAEIVRLGGRLVERRSDSKTSWVVMADPEGNPFCL